MTSDSIAFRQRLARALTVSGMNDRAVAAEVLLLLPGQFLDEYEALYLATWPIGSGVRIGDADAESPVATKWRTSSGQVETRGTASPKGSGSTSKGLGPKDSRAEATKDWADRRLRKLAREIRDRMSDDAGVGVRRCTGTKCRRLAESEWNWCPSCGSPTEEWEGPQ